MAEHNEYTATIPAATGFSMNKDMENFTLKVNLAEAKMHQEFFSYVVHEHFPQDVLNVFLIDQKPIPGLNVKIRPAQVSQDDLTREDKIIQIIFKDKILGVARIIHKHYPKVLVVSLTDAKIIK